VPASLSFRVPGSAVFMTSGERQKYTKETQKLPSEKLKSPSSQLVPGAQHEAPRHGSVCSHSGSTSLSLTLSFLIVRLSRLVACCENEEDRRAPLSEWGGSEGWDEACSRFLLMNGAFCCRARVFCHGTRGNEVSNDLHCVSSLCVYLLATWQPFSCLVNFESFGTRQR
jgi:hypothetical protein